MKKSWLTCFVILGSFFLGMVGCNQLAIAPGEPDVASPTPVLPTVVLLPEATATFQIPTPTPYIPPEHRIGIRMNEGSAEFFDRLTGRKFSPQGVNYVFVPYQNTFTNLLLKVGVYDARRTREDFSILASKGFNTVRVFLDHCNAGVGCIVEPGRSGLNPGYLDNIADMILAARETGIFLLITSNDLPDQGGYSEQANSQSSANFSGYRNSYYLTPAAVMATRRYWGDLLRGLNQRAAPFDAVLGWQLLNEQWMFVDQPPLSLKSGIVKTTTGLFDMADPEQKRLMVSEGLIHYIAEVKSEILMHDPSALVTMGFFAPEIAAPDWYVETASLMVGSDLDFFDFHAYPGWHSMEEHVLAFGMKEFQSKPVILGEYGPFRHVYSTATAAGRAITKWQAESCNFGFDGWLYWTYYPSEESAGDRTWGMVDEDGYFLNLLSPKTHPDPCIEVEFPNTNIAFGKEARASLSLPEEPAQNALDENDASQWGAGADAPQWIEIDLGQLYRISAIRLLIAQWPEGETHHRIRGRSLIGNWVEMFVFRQFTRGGDWLVFEPEIPIEGIQVIRIDTLSSPSWVAWGEVQVFGEAMP